MSVPVVGSVLLSVLLYGDFGDSRRHFRLGRVPTPSSPRPQRTTTTAIMMIDQSSMARILVHHAAMEEMISNIIYIYIYLIYICLS